MKPSTRGWLIGTTVMLAVAAVAFIYVQVGIVTESIKFDLKKIGESVYEARARDGRWPAGITDLEGTSYLTMPYRRDLLETETYVIVWPKDFDADPKANGARILAYDNGSFLALLGRVWACRGDLTVEQLRGEDLAAIKTARTPR